MTLLELVTHLRQSILDDVGGTSVAWADITEDQDDVTQLRWSNEELTRFINEAQKQACRASLLIKTASPTFAVTVAGGTSEYSLDPRVINIKGAYLASTGKELVETEYEDVMGMPSWRDTTGTPTHYISDMETGTIHLYPQPTAADTVNLLVYRLPLTDLDWETAETTSAEIREDHQIDMLYYAAFLAYMKDEANTFDPQRAEYNRQLFEKKFTSSSAYADVRRSRTRNKSIKYQGL